MEELRASLSRDLPEVPSKYFYDDEGSRLFEQITELDEYYQTRTEESILAQDAERILAAAPGRELVELGSGVGRKIRLLLDALTARGALERCVLFEINRSYLEASADTLRAAYPALDVAGVVGDFEFDLDRLGPGGGRLVIFLAGTIGNLARPRDAVFLRALRRQLEPGDAVLIGFDLVKDAGRLEAAYDDAAGVTARFNRNILRVVNDRFDADFEPEAFEHVAFFDAEHAWIEMRLRATKAMDVHVGGGVDVDLHLEPGDEIRTEISAKYTRESVAGLAEAAGMTLDGWFSDPESLFALGLLGVPAV